jgi:hypothetical protein
MAEKAEEDEIYACAGQGKGLHRCLEADLHNIVRGHLKTYITDTEEWASDVYYKLKLRDKEEEEDLWQRGTSTGTPRVCLGKGLVLTLFVYYLCDRYAHMAASCVKLLTQITPLSFHPGERSRRGKSKLSSATK